jgi:hypothetical protein
VHIGELFNGFKADQFFLSHTRKTKAIQACGKMLVGTIAPAKYPV